MTAAVRLFLLALLALAGAAAVGDDALAHSDNCPPGQHATRLNNFCVDTQHLGFADWCEAKSRASKGHYWTLEGEANCASGSTYPSEWCSPFNATGSFPNQTQGSGAPGNVPGARFGLFCNNQTNTLFSDGTCPLPADDPDSYDPDAHACALIHPRINVHAANDEGNTPLHLAAAQGDLAAVNHFLAMGAVVNTLNAAGRTPLGEAAVNNRAAAAARLIAANGHHGTACQAPREVNPNSNSPRCLAPPAGDATVFISAATGGTVSAEWSGNADLQDGETVPVRTLVTFTARPGRGGRLLEWGGVCAGGPAVSPQCVWSAFANATVTAAFECAAGNLRDAARFGDPDGTACLLEHGADVNAGAGSFSRTPLHWAVISARPEVVRVLLATPGIDANQAASNGGSPMVESGFKGNAEIAGLLANHPGIILDAADGAGNTALHSAAAEGHLAVVNTLLAAGAVVNTLNVAGRTALGEALANNRAAVAGRLKEAGGHHGTACAAPQAVNPNAASPPCLVPPTTPQRIFISAATGGTVSAGWAGDADLQSGDMVPPGATVTFTARPGAGGRLSQWGDGACAGRPVDPPECVWNVAAEATVSAVFQCTGSFLNAARFGDIPVASCQLEHGADVNAGVGNHSRTPLHWAVIGVRPAMVRFLLATPGIDANKKAGNGGSPMVESGFKGSAEVAGLLANHPGIILDATNNDGNTALHLAAAGGHLAVVNTLLAAGAEVNPPPNNAGRTALGEALANNRAAVAFRLLEAGGRHGAADLYEHYFPAADRVSKCQGVSGDNDRALDVRDPGAADPAANVAYVCRNRAESKDVCYLRKDGGTGLAGLRTAGGHTFVGADPAPPCTEAHPPCIAPDGALDNDQNPFADNCTGAPAPVSVFISTSANGAVSAEWAGDSDLQNEETVPPGAAVTFTARPDDGYKLVRWTDACADDSVEDLECVLAVIMEVTVGAEFGVAFFEVSLAASAGGTVSAEWEGDADLQSGGTIPFGATVTFTAMPEDGYRFSLWTGACADESDSPCVLAAVTMDATVGAEFGCLDFHESAAMGNLAGLKCNADAGANVNAPNAEGKTPLHLAAGGGHLELVQELLTLGATLNAVDDDDDTPLTEAAEGDHAEIFNLLVAAGGRHAGAECGVSEVPNPERDAPPCVPCGTNQIASGGVCESCGADEVASGGACESCGANASASGGVCECDSGHEMINESCVHETNALPENEATCANVFGGDWVDLSAEHGPGKGVCSGIDINDTFCLAGTVSALPCLGLFNHVRSCNLLGRPALDPFHCGKACAGGKASGARCLESE